MADNRRQYADHPNRVEALENGIAQFDPGKPCGNGHRSLRFTATMTCKECNRLSAQKTREKKTDRPYVSRAQKMKNIEAAKHRSAELMAAAKEAEPALPKLTRWALAQYQGTALSRQNSKHLDSLLMKKVPQ